MKNSDVTRQILTEIQLNPKVSQKKLASQVGISVGMINWHLKRCVGKGFIKLKHAPTRRYLYYLTPEGFTEKARLTANFLRSSFDIFYSGQRQYKALLDLCVANEWHAIGLIGDSELVDLLCLIQLECPEITYKAIFEPERSRDEHRSIPVYSNMQELRNSREGELIQAFVGSHFMISVPELYDNDKLLKLFGLNRSRLLIPGFLQ